MVTQELIHFQLSIQIGSQVLFFQNSRFYLYNYYIFKIFDI